MPKLKPFDSTCSRCDKVWTGYAGGLCPACGGERVASDKVKIKGLGGSTGTYQRGTRYLSDEEGG